MLWLFASCAAPIVPSLPDAGTSVSLLLAVHGGGDDPTVWADDLVAALDAAHVDPDRWTSVALDWSADADTLTTAARRGRRIGESLALEIEAAGYARVHLIAHSVGAHLAHAVAIGIEVDTLQLTLLDPFVGSGLVRWGYGRDRFGEGTTFAESWVNRADGVPSTDGLLPLAHNVDVTDSWPAGADGHRWPIEAYLRSTGSGLGLDHALGIGDEADWAALPPGESSSFALP